MKLPPSVAEIAEAIGEDKALELISKLPRFQSVQRHAGGECWNRTRVMLYVPKTMKPDHQLAQMIGYEHALKLVAAFGGEVMKPAACAGVHRHHRNQRITAMAGRGLSHHQISEQCGITVRQVRNVLGTSKRPPNPPQEGAQP